MSFPGNFGFQNSWLQGLKFSFLITICKKNNFQIHTETEFYSKDRVWGRERTLENLQQG